MDKASDGLISVEEAISRVLEDILPLNSEQVSISEAFGRVLAIEVASRITQPPLAVSAMDGYAVRASDVLSVPITLTQVGEAAAGASFDGSIGDGETVRIFTGAPIPEGANAIVIQEDTKAKGDKIVIKSSVEVGQFRFRAFFGDVLFQPDLPTTIDRKRELGLSNHPIAISHCHSNLSLAQNPLTLDRVRYGRCPYHV